MADYIYLLENRLSAAQQQALSLVRNAVRARDLTLFLTGGAVRDLTGGGSVRDLDVTVQGDVAALRTDLESAGATFMGEHAPAQALFFQFSGGVRVEVASAMAVTYPKPGDPSYEPSSITEDLRRRDFTANAMALSLNEGSYGLLMDPLNGVADIENRELRLVSNYGFLDEPSRLIRAVRLTSRLGWQMEERTRQRYENAKQDDAIASLSNFSRSYELEEIFHDEDPLRIMRALDAENWLKVLSPQLILGKANETALADLREKQGLLQTQGILADHASLAFPLLVAKLSAQDVTELKGSFARSGFAKEIDTLEERTRELQARVASKDAALPSAAWRMLRQAEPTQVLSMFFSSKSSAVQSRIKTFLNDSPTARQKLPYGVMQEMRITPDMPVYNELLDKLFFELMDGKLQTTEELKAYLEPFSPPAPPPPVNLRRARPKKEARPSRAKAKKAAATVVEQEEQTGVAEGLMEEGTLTGPDRGTEPELERPLQGKVAPLAPGEDEPETKASEVVKPVAKKTVKATSVAAAATPEAAAGRNLTATPAPAPEAEMLVPHPEAAEKIAKGKTGPIPTGTEALKPAKVARPQAPEKVAPAIRVVPPEKKAAKTAPAPEQKPARAARADDPGEQSKQGKPALTAKPIAAKSVATKPGAAKSVATKPAAAKSVAAKSVAAKSIATKSIATKQGGAGKAAAKTAPAKKTTVPANASGSKWLSAPVPQKSAARKPAPKKPVVKAAGTVSVKSPPKKSPARPLPPAPAKKAVKAAKAAGSKAVGSRVATKSLAKPQTKTAAKPPAKSAGAKIAKAPAKRR